MTVRGSAVLKDHNPTLILLSYLPRTIVLTMVAYTDRILESTEGVEIKLDTYIYVN